MTKTQLLCVCIVAVVALHVVDADRRGCATSNVNIRTGPSTSHRKVGLLRKGSCLTYRGLSQSGTWAIVDYNGRIRYIFKQYLSLTATPASPHAPHRSQCPNIISRSQWQARSAKRRSRMSNVPANVYVHHATGPSCSTSSVCKSRVRGYQTYHMNTKGWSDIGYSFLIGEDGNVYEGRGWMIIGGHTYGHNSDGYGICFIGDFSNRNPNSAALRAFDRLVQCGISLGHLRSNYVIKGHRDVGSTSCPGTTFYKLIKTWSHYNNPRG